MLPEGFEIEQKLKLPEGFTLESTAKPLPKGFVLDKKPKAPFMERHPTLYGLGRGAVVETGKDITKMLPWVKYVYPSERKRFLELTGYKNGKWYQPKTKKQAQIRELLLADLDFAVLSQWKPLVGGIKEVSGATLQRFLPKTYKVLTKTRGLKKPQQVAGKPQALKKTPVKPVEAAGEEIVSEGIPKTAVQEVMAALKEADVLRAEQEAIYTVERGIKLKQGLEAAKDLPGEQAFRAKLRAFKGEMTQVQFKSIREKVGQKHMDDLFLQIADHPTLSEWEKLPAGKGLAKIFGEFGGKVPTEKEISLLNEVYGKEFVKVLMSKRTMFQKFKKGGLELANIPRALMASFDLSAPLRQGVFLVGHPKWWKSAFKDMFKYFGSPKAYAQLMENIKANPLYETMVKSGLSITELGSLTAREEAFQSNWAELIPGIGKIVRASARAHTGFLNKVRVDAFTDLAKKGVQLGIKDPKYLKDVAWFLNAATGRGNLGALENSAVALNATLFSPRLISSRLSLLNPNVYIGPKLHPEVRKEALKSLFLFAGIASTVASLAWLGGAAVETDPRNADFMKIKVGNTRYDILGGFQQPIRLAAQFVSGKIISSTTGKTLTLGEGYKPITRIGVVGRFLEYKEAPVISFAHGLLRERTAMGEKFDVPTEVANRFIPMVVQDMKDLYNEKGLVGIGLAVPAIFGVGVQTYGGVQSYGLEGKKFPKLNAELLRLKISMGFPSTSVYGIELTNKEYKELKKRAGLEIAKELTTAISKPGYNRAHDHLKIKQIEWRIDRAKEKIKWKMFPKKRRLAAEIKRIENTTLLKGEEAKALAKKRLKGE